MCSTLIHEPAPPVERLEGGVPTRTSTGRVRAGVPGVNPYLLALLNWQQFGPDVAEGYRRDSVWLEPRDGWCHYTATDRACASKDRGR